MIVLCKSSLTRGCVCRLGLLLVLASAVIDHILLSQMPSDFRYEYYSRIWLGGLRRNTKASMSITGFRAEIWSWDLSNTKYKWESSPINCCRSSPAQWFLAPSPTGLTNTIFYCLTGLGGLRENPAQFLSSLARVIATPCFAERNSLNIAQRTKLAATLAAHIIAPCATACVGQCRVTKFLTGAFSSTARSVLVFNMSTTYSRWWPTGWSSSPGKGKIFLHSTSSRPALGLTQPLMQWVPGALAPRVKRPEHEADHSPPVSAEVKNTRIYTSTPPYVSTM
jgi:hypothetical protein